VINGFLGILYSWAFSGMNDVLNHPISFFLHLSFYFIIAFLIEKIKKKFILGRTKEMSSHAKRYNKFFNFSEIMNFNKSISKIVNTTYDYKVVDKLENTEENESVLVYTMLAERLKGLSIEKMNKEKSQI
jgi:hypothetical protein